MQPFPPEVTLQDLGKLPLRALVAFAVRCAQRVVPLLTSSETSVRERTDTALRAAANFARGQNQGPEPYAAAQAAYAATDDVMPEEGQFAIYAAGHAASAAANAVQETQLATRGPALDAVASSYGAYRVLLSYATGRVPGLEGPGTTLLQSARADYDSLLALQLGQFAELGGPIEPGEQGPLGTL